MLFSNFLPHRHIHSPDSTRWTTGNGDSSDGPSIDTEEEVLGYVSKKYGVPTEWLAIINEVVASFPVSGRRIRRWKVGDNLNGGIYELSVDESGTPVDIEEIIAEERRAYFEKYGKLSPELYDYLQKIGPEDKVHVWIWLSGIDHNKVVDKVMLRHPEVKGKIKVLNLRPAPFDENWNYNEDLEYLADQIYAEILQELEMAYGQRENEFVNYMKMMGYEYEITYKAKYVPVTFVKLPKRIIMELSKHENISSISSVKTAVPALNSAAYTVKANVVWRRGIYGRGPKIAVVEDDGISDENPYLAIPSYYDSNKRIGWHATAVAGVIASTHSTYRGIAFRAYGLLSANAISLNDNDTLAAIEWALSSGADIINICYGTDTDRQIQGMDRYMDHLVWHHRKTVAVAAGNKWFHPWWGWIDDVVSPGLGYNVITVGAINDKNTGSDWLDDEMWEDSLFTNPISPNGDREKPEVVAVGVKVSTTTTSYPWVGYLGDGTSLAAPMVTGEAALLMSASSGLKTRSEAVKAIIMASAGHNIEGDRRLSDKDGVGAIICSTADDIRRKGWWKWESLTLGDFPRTYSFTVPISGTVRVVIVWSSHPPDVHPPPSNPPYEWLESDLDLEVTNVYGHKMRSASFDNSYEIVEIAAPIPGTSFTVEITQKRFNGPYEYVGLAYAFF